MCMVACNGNDSMSSENHMNRAQRMFAHSSWWVGLITMAAFGVLACHVHAQTSAPENGRASETDRPEYIEAQRVPEQLLSRQPRQVLILPSEPGEFGQDQTQVSGGAVAKLTPDAHRLPDGYIVAAREARIDLQGDWYVAHLSQAKGVPDAPPLRVLPNKRLMMIEAIHKATHKSPQLVVTGRITEFQGVNYLLAENLIECAVDKPEVAPSATRSTAPPTDAEATAQPALTQPAGRTEPRAEDIVAQLLATKPMRAVVLPEHLPEAGVDSDSSSSEAGESGSTGREGPRWPEETMLIDRVGRLVPGERWWTFAFEDRGKNPANPPIRLLPNRLLESAIALSGGGTRGIVFVISGEVTEYQGFNYLLLRKILVRRDFGNFG